MALLFVYFPILISIISSGLILEENYSLLKVIPISSSKLLLEKFLFFFLTYFLVGGFYLSILLLKFYDITKGHSKYLMALVYFSLLLSFLSFSFATFLNKKIYVFILSFLLVYLNILIISLKVIFDYINFILNEIYYGIFLFLLIFSFVSIFYFFKKKIRGEKIKFIEKLILIFIFFIPPLYFMFYKSTAETKRIILDSDIIQINKNEFLAFDRFEEKLKSINLKKREIKELKNLSGFYFKNYYDGIIHFNNYSMPQKIKKCNKEIEVPSLNYYDIKRGKFEKAPSEEEASVIIDGIKVFFDLIATDKYLVIVQSNEKNECFSFECYRFVVFKEGIFYIVKKDFEYDCRFFDFKDLKEKQIIKGKYYFPYAYYIIKEKVNEGKYFFLEDKNNLYRIKIPEGNVDFLKENTLLIDFFNGHYITYKKESGDTILYLNFYDKLIDTKTFNNMIFYPVHFKKNGICLLKDSIKKIFMLLKYEDNKLKFYFLPKSTYSVIPILGGEEIFIYKKSIFSLKKTISLYNFKTGKERSL